MISFKGIYYSFPVQLVILQFRNHFLFLVIWLIILGAITGDIGSKFGVSYLFLTPEYMGKVTALNYFIVGLAYGAFLFSWNLSIYLLSAYRFPFLATMERPFLKFCINNGLIPLLMLLLYANSVLRFYHHHHLTWTAIGYIFSLFAGIAVFVFTIIFYFRLTNKDIFSFLKARKSRPDMSPPIIGGQRLNKTDFYRIQKRSWRVDTFLSEKFKWRIVRGIGHYDIKILMKVFRQNHINVLIVQLVTIILLMGLGLKMENKYFRIPTAASLLLLGSVVISMIGAIGFWFKRWTIIVWIAILLLLNNITKYDFFNINCKAYGIDYQANSIPYNNFELDIIVRDSVLAKDRAQAIKILDKWRAKFPKDKKPKMLFVSASGGGLKASLWTMCVLQEMDRKTNEQFFEHTTLISGASGGMLAAAYYRELMLQKRLGKDINPQAPEFRDNSAKDLLNSIYFSIVTNDIFIPMVSTKRKGRIHRRDRGYMFELQFNENTDSVLEKPLGAYREPEEKAIIPRIILSPSVVNDGRRLIISPFYSSYLMSTNFEQYHKGGISLDAIDFKHLFKTVNPDSLNFVSALRMNATYPIVLPSVNLPSEPSLEIADAGFRDNLGKATGIRFVNNFKDWIKENTSGVVFVQIAGWEKFNNAPNDVSKSGWIASLFKPFGILTDISLLQDYESDINYGLLAKYLGNDFVDLVRFEYVSSEENERASMSFHLTEFEKEDIIMSINTPTNLKAQEKLLNLLNE